MLVIGKYILETARKKRYGVVAPDFLTLNSARVFARTAEELKAPLMLSFAQGHSSFISLEEAAMVGRFWANKVNVPIAVHLDHGQDYDFLKQAVDLGFSSIMIDASMHDIDENIRLTKEVVAYAHSKGVSVEAEIGHVGGETEGVEGGEPTENVYTTVEDAVHFVKMTEVDSLAVSIGTSHGAYKNSANPQLNFERLKELSQAVPVPLVLHGGSGTGDDNLRRAVKEGITKLNVYTDFLVGAMKELDERKPATLTEVIRSTDEGMKKVLTHYINLISKC